MQRHLFLGTMCSLFAVGVVLAKPARPLYEPPEPAKAVAPKFLTELGGTAWLGKYGATDRIFVFEADGTLSYKSSTPTGTVFKNRGRWWFDGSTLSFEHTIGVNVNNKMMDFRGTVVDKDTIVGEAIMKTGAKSQQTLKRTTVPVSKVKLK